MKFFRGQKVPANVDPAKLLDLPGRPLRTLAPVDPPPNADDATKLFFSQSEWLQPFLNRSCAPDGVCFEECNETMVALAWGPMIGRNFNIFSNAAQIGDVSVFPCFATQDGWGALRIRLIYPVEHLSGEEVHSILTSLICATGRQVENDTEALATKASALASKAMTVAMWDRRPDARLVVECMTQGPWDAFWSSIKHWEGQGIDPWEKWERQRGVT